MSIKLNDLVNRAMDTKEQTGRQKAFYPDANKAPTMKGFPVKVTMNILSKSEMTELQESIADSSTELIEISGKLSELFETCSSADSMNDTDLMMMQMQFSFQRNRLKALESDLEEYDQKIENADLAESGASGSSFLTESLLLSRQILLQNLLMIRQSCTLIDRVKQDFNVFFREHDRQFDLEIAAFHNQCKEMLARSEGGVSQIEKKE